MTQVHPMTREEFLASEERQEFRWEFDGVRATAMTGGTVAQAAIQLNVTGELRTRLRGTACRVFGPDLKLATGSGYRYPNAQVTCSAQVYGATVSERPVAVFEVLSESTARLDRTVKLREYLSLPSVQYYVMLEQDAAVATVLTRTETGWAIKVVVEADVIDLPLIKVQLPLHALYEGVTFGP